MINVVLDFLMMLVLRDRAKQVPTAFDRIFSVCPPSR